MSILFEAISSQIESLKIIKVPLSPSEKLPSCGMVMVKGTMNDVTFKAPLEPDGKGGHWFEVNDILCEEVGVAIGQIVSFNIEPINEWIEPEVPTDIMNAIIKSDIKKQWDSITTKSRWDWIRWIRSTKNPLTRKNIINVTCSKLQNGDKRPCCFDRSRCTIEKVSKSGVLFD